MRSLHELTHALVKGRDPRRIRWQQSDLRSMALSLKEAGADVVSASAAELLGPPSTDMLKEALAVASRLEWATIPAYLVAQWSVIDDADPVVKSLSAVVHEEMLHVALVNNMLAALGGQPQLSGASAPRYPSRLPGDVHPELTISLSGLNDESLDVFLEIEKPIALADVDHYDHAGPAHQGKLIRDFYEAIRHSFHLASPGLATSAQIAGPLAPMVVATLEDVDRAIDTIITQGEGAGGAPLDTSPHDLSHYYRFLEIRLQQRLIWDPIARVLRRGQRLARPDVYPIAPAPPDGWGRAAPSRIRELTAHFNARYSRMLDSLQLAWGQGGHAALLRAIEAMFELKQIAREMFRTPGPDGRGHAPEFRYVQA